MNFQNIAALSTRNRSNCDKSSESIKMKLKLSGIDIENLYIDSVQLEVKLIAYSNREPNCGNAIELALSLESQTSKPLFLCG